MFEYYLCMVYHHSHDVAFRKNPNSLNMGYDLNRLNPDTDTIIQLHAYVYPMRGSFVNPTS